MSRQKAIELIEKYQNGSATSQERSMLETWYNQYAQRNNDLDFPEDLWKRRDYSLMQIVGCQPLLSVRRTWLFPKLAYKIAAAVALIVLGIYFFKHKEGISHDKVYANDIAPGKNTATLILSNGKTISLSNAKTGVVIGNDKLAYNDGSAVANLSPSELNGVAREDNNNTNPLSPQGGSLSGGERSRVQTLTVSTPRGGQYQLTLPDGTKVWLNAASTLSFPSTFAGTSQSRERRERRIKLSGEAYFEVAKDRNHPFIVTTVKQDVQVLGTHFNINSYADEETTKTTLLEGSVKISGHHSNAGQDNIVLKPNQQAILNGNQFKVQEVDVRTAIDWKEERFVFNDESLDAILRKVARWYNVDIEDQRKDRHITTFTGVVSRFEKVSKVLSKLELTGEVKFEIQGRKIIVK